MEGLVGDLSCACKSSLPFLVVRSVLGRVQGLAAFLLVRSVLGCSLRAGFGRRPVLCPQSLLVCLFVHSRLGCGDTLCCAAMTDTARTPQHPFSITAPRSREKKPGTPAKGAQGTNTNTNTNVANSGQKGPRGPRNSNSSNNIAGLEKQARGEQQQRQGNRQPRNNNNNNNASALGGPASAPVMHTQPLVPHSPALMLTPSYSGQGGLLPTPQGSMPIPVPSPHMGTPQKVRMMPLTACGPGSVCLALPVLGSMLDALPPCVLLEQFLHDAGFGPPCLCALRCAVSLWPGPVLDARALYPARTDVLSSVRSCVCAGGPQGQAPHCAAPGQDGAAHRGQERGRARRRICGPADHQPGP